MAKKKNEKDVLIVRDEKTGEISVVAGLQADGTPRRTPPKMENAQDFLQFDKNGDVLDNFFRNFFRQCKEPSRFGFYRIAADQAENLLGVMKELLKDPWPMPTCSHPTKWIPLPTKNRWRRNRRHRKSRRKNRIRQTM